MKWISMVALPLGIIGAMGGLLAAQDCGCEGKKRGIHGTCNGFMCAGSSKFSSCAMGDAKFACNRISWCS